MDDEQADATRTLNVTVGVVTHERSALFKKMLAYLKASIEACTHDIVVLVVNNSGTDAHDTVRSLIDQSGVRDICSVRLIDSPENNISVGRNLIIDECETQYLAFIDDDEYPREQWLQRLIDQQALGIGQMVAGPVLPIYPTGTAKWIREIDLHNRRGRSTGDVIRRSGSGNCLLDLEAIGDSRFKHGYGRTGGGDGAFFEEQYQRGLKLVWCAEALIDEVITPDRSTWRYAIFRFIKQGNNYARYYVGDESRMTQLTFRIRAAAFALLEIPCGLFVYPFSATRCAWFWKRGFIHLGQVIPLKRDLYG